MNGDSSLILPQSPTIVAETPPHSTSKVKHDSNNKKLELYNSLFGQGRNKICDKTGLQLSESLNYSLYTFLHLCDVYWVLAMIGIDDIDNLNSKYGRQLSNNKINQIGTVISKFCQNDARKLNQKNILSN